MPKNAFNWYVCNPHEVGGGWTSKKACLINIQQRRPPRVLVMCLFIHPVQYKHFRATYTIHNSIIRQIWGLGNGRQLEEVVYKCKKYAGPFMFVWNAHNFAFLFLMFLFLLVNHSDSTQSMRPLLARLAKKKITKVEISPVLIFYHDQICIRFAFQKAVTKSSECSWEFSPMHKLARHICQLKELCTS